jgi:hypothetical protein
MLQQIRLLLMLACEAVIDAFTAGLDAGCDQFTEDDLDGWVYLCY